MVLRRLLLGLLIAFFPLCLFGQYSSSLDIVKVLQTDTTVIGQKIGLPSGNSSEFTVLKIRIKPGQSTGWHTHTSPVFAYVESGTLTVEIEGKGERSYQRGTTFAEVIDTAHNGSNKGTEDVVLIAFFISEKGKPLSNHLQ